MTTNLRAARLGWAALAALPLLAEGAISLAQATFKGLHVLFVGKGESARLAAIVRAAQREGVLAVSEAERGLEAGSAINFVVSEDRVGFEVSLDSAEKSGHRISSRMLAAARRVVPKAL